MHVLIAVASRHGATTGIGEAIAGVLRSEGHLAEVKDAGSVTSVEGYDAVVLGSGVYAGRWLSPAKGFADRFAAALSGRPVWLFSSGPLGDPPKPSEDPVDAAPMVARLGARGHRTFAGKLDRGDLGLGEKTIVAVVRAPDGDFRMWPEIAAWGKQISRELEPVPVAVAGSPSASDGPA